MNTETFLILSPLVILALLLYIFILLKNNNLKNNDLYDNSKKLDDLKVSIDIFKETQAGLKESQTNLKESVHDMYTLLTKGGSKHIGQFGEITLRKILENSGLKEGTNFLEEKLHGSEKPDYVIMLPEGRKIVIDSKVSTKDYAQYLKTNDSNLKEIHKKDHITSLKRHIKSLSSTEYRSLYGTDTLDLIIMFMPIEGAYILACEESLIEEAFSEKIAIVGPTTLIASIQIILRTWNNKKQSEATENIIKLASDIYDQTRLVSESFCEFEDYLEKSKLSVSAGKKRAENLVNKVENFRKIGGLEPKKEIPDRLKSVRKND